MQIIYFEISIYQNYVINNEYILNVASIFSLGTQNTSEIYKNIFATCNRFDNFFEVILNKCYCAIFMGL